MCETLADQARRLVGRYWFIVIVVFGLFVVPFLAIKYASWTWTGGAEFRLEFADHSIDASNAIRETAKSAKYVRHHVGWQVSAMFYLLAALGVIVLSTAYILELRGKVRWVVLLLIVAWVFKSTWDIVNDEPVLIAQRLGKALFTPDWALDQNFSFGAIGASRLDEAIKMSQCFTSAVFVFLAFALFAIISRPRIGDFAGAIDQIVAQRARMRILFFAGSATLFFGVVAIHSLVEWRAAILPSIERREVVEAGATILMLWTSAWTMVLAALYLPARLILARRTEKLYEGAHGRLEGVTRHEWIEKHGLRVTYVDLMVKVAAILGPLLTGKGLSLLS